MWPFIGLITNLKILNILFKQSWKLWKFQTKIKILKIKIESVQTFIKKNSISSLENFKIENLENV